MFGAGAETNGVLNFRELKAALASAKVKIIPDTNLDLWLVKILRETNAVRFAHVCSPAPS